MGNGLCGKRAWVSGRVLAHWTFDDAGGAGTLEGYFVEVFRMADSVDVDMQPVRDTSALSAIRFEPYRRPLHALPPLLTAVAALHRDAVGACARGWLTSALRHVARTEDVFGKTRLPLRCVTASHIKLVAQLHHRIPYGHALLYLEYVRRRHRCYVFATPEGPLISRPRPTRPHRHVQSPSACNMRLPWQQPGHDGN